MEEIFLVLVLHFSSLLNQPFYKKSVSLLNINMEYNNGILLFLNRFYSMFKLILRYERFLLDIQANVFPIKDSQSLHDFQNLL